MPYKPWSEIRARTSPEVLETDAALTARMQAGVPEWATHIAVDRSGAVCAYDKRPVWNGAFAEGAWIPVHGGKCVLVDELGASVDAALASPAVCRSP